MSKFSSSNLCNVPPIKTNSISPRNISLVMIYILSYVMIFLFSFNTLDDKNSKTMNTSNYI